MSVIPDGLNEFDPKGDGYLQSACRACRRIRTRERQRWRYRHDATFRASRLTNAANQYARKVT